MKSPASEDRFETYYSILGVSRTASTAEIDRLVDTTVHRFEENAKEAERDQPKLWAYRRLSLYVHPDKGGDPEAFRRVKRAHNVLKDPELRKLYSQFGPALLPSPGHLIGSGTIGRLVPFSMSATGGIACQFFLVMGSFGVNLWGLGCAVTAGVSWLKARATNGHTDSVAPAILGGLLLGNVAGFCLGASTRGAMRLLPWK